MLETQNYKTIQEVIRQERRENMFAAVVCAAMIAAPVALWLLGVPK